MWRPYHWRFRKLYSCFRRQYCVLFAKTIFSCCAGHILVSAARILVSENHIILSCEAALIVVRWWMMPQLGKRTNYHSPWQLWFPFKILGSGRLKFSAAGSSCYLRHSVSVRLSIVWPSGRLALSRGENGERSDAIWNCLWLSYWAYPKLFELIWDYCGRSRQSLKMKTGMPSDFTPLSNNFINPKGTISHNENIGTYTQSKRPSVQLVCGWVDGADGCAGEYSGWETNERTNCLSVCLSACLSVCLSVCMYVCSSVHPLWLL